MHIRDDGLKEKEKYRFNLFGGKRNRFPKPAVNIIAKTDWTEARGAVPYRLYIAGGKSLSNLDARSFVKAVTSESRNEFAKGNRMVFPWIACRLLLLFVLAWAWKTRRGVGESVK